MEPIRVGGDWYVKENGTWYQLIDGKRHEVTSLEWIGGLNTIYEIDRVFTQPFLGSINEV